jgi:ribosomal-protein-alanine N-acetyltransferase
MASDEMGMGIPVEIIPMKMEDLDEILSIEVVSFPSSWSRTMFIRELHLPISRNLVAKIEVGTSREIVGYANYWIIPGEAQIHNIAVRKDMMRQGIASKLVMKIIRLARDEGASWGTLEVRRSNKSAIGLYEKNGFVIKGVRPFYYTDAKEDALIMWADLNACLSKRNHYGA